MSGLDSMFATLDRQATQPPTIAPEPPSMRTGLDAMFAALDRKPIQQATANLTDAQNIAPDQAAQALKASRATGIPQPAAEVNLDEAQKSAQLKANVETLDTHPNLTGFIADNPLAARLAQDDFEKLGLVERLTTAIKTGASSALMANQLGRLGNFKQAAAGAETPQTDAQIQELQTKLKASPKARGVVGFVQDFTGFLTGLVDNAITGGGQGAATGGVIGAGLGAAAGGVGAVPGAVAGMGIGAAAGFNVDMARVAAGNTYLRLGQIRGENGEELTEGAKQFGAIFTGAATYALGMYGTKIESALIRDTAESIAQKAIAKAAETPTFTRAAANFIGAAAKGSAQGAAFMTAMEASGIVGEEIAKIVSRGDFETNPQEIIDRLADAAVNGAVMLGTMHGAMRGLSLYGDVRAASRANVQAEVFKNAMDGAAGSKLRERDLQAFQDFMRRQTDGSPVENIFIPAEVVRELYQGAKLDPESIVERAQDPLFGFVKDMPEQIREATQTGGDVVIPMADFVTHLAGSPIAEKLLPDIRFEADGMSVNDAKAFSEEYQRRVKESVNQAANEEPSAQQRISDEVRQQAMQAGYPESVANRYAALYASRYATRGERLGIDPYEAWKESGVQIQKGKEGEPVVTQRDEKTEVVVQMRKRASVLKSILECMA